MCNIPYEEISDAEVLLMLFERCPEMQSSEVQNFLTECRKKADRANGQFLNGFAQNPEKSYWEN